MKLRFLFCKKIHGFKLTGWIIQFGQKSAFSHLAIETSDDGLHDEPMVFESVLPRSRRLPFRLWVKEHHSVIEAFEFHIADERMKQEVIAALYEGINRKYSILQIGLIALGIIVPPLERVFGRWTVNGGYFLHCTEYGARVGRVVKMAFNEDADAIDLLEMHAACKALTEKGVYKCPASL